MAVDLNGKSQRKSGKERRYKKMPKRRRAQYWEKLKDGKNKKIIGGIINENIVKSRKRIKIMKQKMW